ncbi:MAG: hypothetical protein ABIQ70_00305 [Dokdonella sp.]
MRPSKILVNHVHEQTSNGEVSGMRNARDQQYEAQCTQLAA